MVQLLHNSSDLEMHLNVDLLFYFAALHYNGQDVEGDVWPKKNEICWSLCSLKASQYIKFGSGRG